jgi:hypothetical protein
MNIISNVFSYIYSVFNKTTNDIDESSTNYPITNEPITNEPTTNDIEESSTNDIDKSSTNDIDKSSTNDIDKSSTNETTNNDQTISDASNIEDLSKLKFVFYIFINTANIYNGSKLMLTKLKTEEYKNKYILIYLLKSDTIEPLFKKPLVVNKYNIELIKSRLSKSRRHLHTLIEAIDSFIEYNNIKNYTIYY